MGHLNLLPLLLILAAASPAAGQDVAAGVPGPHDDWRRERNRLLDAHILPAHDPASILIHFRRDAGPAEVAGLMARAGLQTIETFPLLPGLHHARTAAPVEETLAVIARLDPGGQVVEYAEPDRFSRMQAVPDDPSFGQLWGLHNTGQTIAGSDTGTRNADIDAPRAWDTFRGNPEFVIAIFDTGLRKTHEDLAPNLWSNPGEVLDGLDNDGNGRIDDLWGWDFINQDNDPSDDNNHGTHCAGTVGARGDNGRGIVGVNWYCRLASMKISSATASVSDSAVISALSYCVQENIRLSNHSWGGYGYSTSLYNAISAARAAGHLVIASAGNDNSNNDVRPFYPASFNLDNIISVAAIDNDNAKAGFSNYGPASVDLAAPGVMVLSGTRYHDAAYAYFHGTSMAAPHVAGVAALVWGRNPDWTYLQVRQALLSTAKPIPSMTGRCVTGGSVNALRALSLQLAPEAGPR